MSTLLIDEDFSNARITADLFVRGSDDQGEHIFRVQSGAITVWFSGVLRWKANPDRGTLHVFNFGQVSANAAARNLFTQSSAESVERTIRRSFENGKAAEILGPTGSLVIDVQFRPGWILISDSK